MPIGSPKPQTIATKKYEQKAGFVSKSYKLKKELVEEFAKACEDAKVSQAGQLSVAMKEFSNRKEVEQEYIKSKNDLFLILSKVESTISSLKKIQREIEDNKIQDDLGDTITELFDIKEQGRAAVLRMYDGYNELYIKANK